MSEEIKKMVDTIGQLQQGIYALQTEKQVLNQTLGEIMTANVQLRTALTMMEAQCKSMVEQKDGVIADLNAQLAVLSKPAEPISSPLEPNAQE